MKKYIFFVAALLAIAGCQNEKLQDDSINQKLITHTFSIETEDADVKSYYDPSDQFVKLTKTESIAVGCAPITSTGAPINEIVEAKRSDNTYSFTHTADATATGYNYFFVMPYRGRTNISTNGAKSAMYVKIDGVQHPTATSFDPLQDYILGEAVLNVEEQKSAISSTNLKLKRLFALVRVTLRDGANVFNGDPLMSVSMGFPLTDNTDKKNNLASLVYLRSIAPDTGDLLDFDSAGANGYADVTTDHVSPTVTAEYSDGLAIDNGTYTVWYVTLPVEKAAETVLTVTAQSKNRKVTRKIALPSDMKLEAGVINDIKINITGEGYVAEDTADPNDYWSIYNAGQDIVAGGLTINKSKYPEATLLSGTQIKNTDLQKGGLIFVDGDFTATGHLKLAKGSIIIGRYKDTQPTVSMPYTTDSKGKDSGFSIYLDNGNIILKNLNIGGTSLASRLLVISKNASAVSSDYAVIEDCNITALKNVCGYASGEPTYVIKNLTFDNCIIKMAGTDANYSVMNINSLSAAGTDSSVYKDVQKFEISNCVIFAEKPYLNATPQRRLLMDLGSGAAGEKYDFPLENATIVVNNNTLYNINTNGNVIARAFYCKSAEINSNVVYNDYACLAPETNFKANYMFGLYSGIDNPNNGAYNIKKNYSYGYYDETSQGYYVKTVIEKDNTTLDDKTMSWTYGKTGYSPSYTTSSNNQANGTVKDDPFTTVDMTKGYFPVNSSNIQKATGASYDTKYWVK